MEVQNRSLHFFFLFPEIPLPFLLRLRRLGLLIATGEKERTFLSRRLSLLFFILPSCGHDFCSGKSNCSLPPSFFPPSSPFIARAGGRAPTGAAGESGGRKGIVFVISLFTGSKNLFGAEARGGGGGDLDPRFGKSEAEDKRKRGRDRRFAGTEEPTKGNSIQICQDPDRQT